MKDTTASKFNSYLIITTNKYLKYVTYRVQTHGVKLELTILQNGP